MHHFHLVLWRHADAVDGQPDLERPLSRLGLTQASNVGQWLDQHLPQPRRIVVSPARRTCQTAQGLTEQFETDPRIAPDQPLSWFLDAMGLDARPQDGGVLVMVGHQPTLGRMATHLLPDMPELMAFERAMVVWMKVSGKGAKRRIEHLHTHLPGS